MADPGATLLTFGEQVAVTRSYIVKAGALKIELAAIADCRLVNGTASRSASDSPPPPPPPRPR